jgi:uncharacterized protein
MEAAMSAPGQAASTLSQAERQALLRVASAAVRHALLSRVRPAIDPARFPPALQKVRATFVTLMMHGRLRGCIGSLAASQPLVVDVAVNAVNAAFSDPRFGPVGYHEVEQLVYHISILSPAEAMTFADEADLLSQVRPGIDGLILEEPAQSRRGTFLPAVWEQLPEPTAFLQHLKAKAGLPGDYWSATLKVSRYTAESVE